MHNHSELHGFPELGKELEEPNGSSAGQIRFPNLEKFVYFAVSRFLDSRKNGPSTVFRFLETRKSTHEPPIAVPGEP
jgi:hypothetical protein